MSTTTASVLGYASSNKQFVVKADHYDIGFSESPGNPELKASSPVEYILAGLAGCIHAVGKQVAKELNIEIRSLEVEISGELDSDKFDGMFTAQRAGFKSVSVQIKTDTSASLKELNKWLAIVEQRCPAQDNLINPTPVSLSLRKKKY